VTFTANIKSVARDSIFEITTSSCPNPLAASFSRLISSRSHKHRQGAEQHQSGEHEAHGSPDDGVDGVEGDGDQGHEEDEHEGGHVGADSSHEGTIYI